MSSLFGKLLASILFRKLMKLLILTFLKELKRKAKKTKTQVDDDFVKDLKKFVEDY